MQMSLGVRDKSAAISSIELGIGLDSNSGSWGDENSANDASPFRRRSSFLVGAPPSQKPPLDSGELPLDASRFKALPVEDLDADDLVIEDIATRYPS